MHGNIRCRGPGWMDNIVEEDNRISRLKKQELGLKAGPQGNISIGRSTENFTFAARPYPKKPTVPDKTRGQEFGDAPAWVVGWHTDGKRHRSSGTLYRRADQGHPRLPDGSCKWLRESAQVLGVCHRLMANPYERAGDDVQP
ncbi:hypothetical protein CSOJ01_03663 [Colletotrichum sojae]|uniref:Uncharacterized protein n=1 Tax=Colletotrichum sojae TaxID=2175907 RepID=A0A8H6JM26_9PEZI|nr:hypothetical protein CSOJ01_03663 [Colletotrichum sojae]